MNRKFVALPKICLGTIWYDISLFKELDVPMATVFCQACFLNFVSTFCKNHDLKSKMAVVQK